MLPAHNPKPKVVKTGIRVEVATARNVAAASVVEPATAALNTAGKGIFT
ncbi:MAG: hypothetical protein LBJ17_05920 [Dysgonamonadaceae bacterium]|nr:hypothetical protein [Dysgonamonadaceae bacterium]